MKLEVAPGIFTDATPEKLALLNERWQQNPLTRYFPQPKQQPFHAAVGKKTPIVAYFGGNQSGKTHCTIADDLIQALPEDIIPEWLLPYKRWQPPFHAWVCCPKYAKLEESIFLKIKELCPPSQFSGGSFERAYSKQDKRLEFACGSTFGFKTYDQDVDAYASATLHRVHWDEEPPGEHGHDIRKEARARLLKFGGDEILSMTPLQGLSWVNDEVFERWERGDERIFCVRADMDDNKYLSEEFKRSYLEDLTDEERQARKEGRFVHFRGKVYQEFKDDLHVTDRPEIEHVQGLDTVVGIDPGIRTTGITFAGFDNDNSMLVYDELYLHNEDTIPENAAELIRKKLAAWGADPIYFVIDPSSRNRNPVTGEHVAAAYMRAGIPTIPGNADDVETGVFEVKRRLQTKDAQGNPSPLLLIAPNCGTTKWEFGRYRMDDRADGKFAVVKEDDHILDAIRYVAMSRPLGPSGPTTQQDDSFIFQGDRAPSSDYFDQPATDLTPMGLV